MRFHRWCHLWTLVLLCTVHSLTQAAPPCDKSLEPVNGKTGYQSRDAVRCEGMYASNVSSPPGGLDLVGLARGSITFDPNVESVVKLIAVATDQPVRVLGVGIPVKTYYRLDALIPPAGVLEWRLADVVGPLGLRPDQIGLVAFVESDPSLYLPLGREKDGAVTLLVRPSDSATELYWRSAERRAGQCGKMGAWSKLDTPGGLDRGSPGRIELPAGTGGDLCLEAQAVPRQGSSNLRGLWHIRTGL